MSYLTPEQKTLADALVSFPKATEASKSLEQGWPAGYNLYRALRRLNRDFLSYPGRFMYNPISVLREGKYYLIGKHPARNRNKTQKENMSLCKEIREWSENDTHAIVDEIWKNQYYQSTVKALCREIGAGLCGLCASNVYFCRNKIKKMETKIDMLAEAKKKIGTFWRIHEALLDIVRPAWIFVIGLDVFHEILKFIRKPENKAKWLLYTGKTSISDGECNCTVVKAEYQDRPLMLMGIPCPSRRHNLELSRHQEVLKQIKQMVDACSTTGKNNSL